MSFLFKVCSARTFHNVAQRSFTRNLSSKFEQLENSYIWAASKKYVDENHVVLMRPIEHFRKTPANCSMLNYSTHINHWIKLPQKQLDEMMEFMDYCYSSFKIINDVMDGSDSQKNEPAAHVVLGVPSTVNGGFYALNGLTEETLKFCPDVGPEIFTRNITKCFRGTGLEIEFRENFKCPTELEYMAVAMEKWFCYLNVALELMQHMSKNEQDIAKVTKMLSWFYCIINDYSNVLNPPISEGKKRCDEGNFTFPVIHAIKTKGNLEVYDMFCQRKSDVDSKFRLIEILEKEGSFEFTRNYLKELHKEMIDATKKLGGNPLLESSMNALLADVLSQRPRTR